jgi:hypothetical protein
MLRRIVPAIDEWSETVWVGQPFAKHGEKSKIVCACNQKKKN